MKRKFLVSYLFEDPITHRDIVRTDEIELDKNIKANSDVFLEEVRHGYVNNLTYNVFYIISWSLIEE